MRFDSSLFWHPEVETPWDRQVVENREYAQGLEALGFTTGWSCEHHLWHDYNFACTPNPVMTSLDVANHTTTIRVGQSPFSIMERHPILVAEDIALLDNMTQGRVDFGVGRGIDLRWGAQFVKYADRRDQAQNRAYFEECMDIVIKAWTEDALTYKGRFFTIPTPGWKETHSIGDIKIEPPYYNAEGELVAVKVMPRPYQRPHPPVWVMVGSDASYAYCGTRGFGAMGGARSPEGLRESFTIYREAAAKAGRQLELGEHCSTQFPTYIARTMDEAISDCRAGMTQRRPRSADKEKVRRDRQNQVGSTVQLSDDDLNLDPFDFSQKFGLSLIGTADFVAERLERLRTVAGFRHYQLFPSITYLSFQQAMKSLELFGTQVMPRFLGRPAPEPQVAAA